MEPFGIMYNISIVTVYDVIIFSDDVSIYAVDLFKEIVTLNCQGEEPYKLLASVLIL